MSKPLHVRPYPIPTRRYPPRPFAPRRLAAIAPRRPWYGAPAVIGSGLALSLTLLLILAMPWLRPCDPLAMSPADMLRPPSAQHWLGQDQFGRDVLCRTVYGARRSVPVGLLAVGMACLPGVVLGVLAGYYEGWVRTLVGMLTDVMLAFPGLLLAGLVLAWLGPGLRQTTLAIGLIGMPRYIRMARSSVLHLRRAWFVRAAHIVGCTDGRILVRHIWPNMLGSMLVLVTMDIAWAMLQATTLSFLGLGAQPPIPEWGAMINEGRGFLRQAPWIGLSPGLLLMGLVLQINLFGDAIRKSMNHYFV